MLSTAAVILVKSPTKKLAFFLLYFTYNRADTDKLNTCSISSFNGVLFVSVGTGME